MQTLYFTAPLDCEEITLTEASVAIFLNGGGTLN